MEHHHRSGPLKQQNKNFKAGKHDTKGGVKRRAAGKIERENPKNLAIAPSRHEQVKNKRDQLAQAKKQEAIERRRLGIPDLAPPRVVTIISLNETCNPNTVRELLLKSNITNSMDIDNGNGNTTIGNGNTITLGGSKVRMTLLICPTMNYSDVLEYTTVSDMVLFLMDASKVQGDSVKSELCEKVFTIIKAQSVPTSIVLLQNFNNVPQKKKNEVKKLHQTYFHFHFPDEPKILPIDSADETNQVLRYIESTAINEVAWKKHRPFLLIDQASESKENSNDYVIEGFLRGNNLNSKQIINIPEIGDFQIDKIEEVKDPYTPKRKYIFSPNSNNNNTNTSIGNEDKLLEQSLIQEKETLQTYNIPDPMQNEQYLPSNEEIEMTKKNMKLVPKGTSAYQASWYLDEEQDGFGEDEEYNEDDDIEMNQGDDNDAMKNDNEEMKDIEEEDGEEEDDNFEDEEVEQVGDDKDSKWKQFKHKHQITDDVLKEMEKIDDEKDQEDSDDEMKSNDNNNNNKKDQLNKVNKNKNGEDSEDDGEESRKQKEQDEILFPDEVDSPGHMPARIRFSRYRGLKSFRSSPWDPKENLPLDYARIFQFHSFHQSMKGSIKLSEKSPAKPGMYIRITLKDLSVQDKEKIQTAVNGVQPRPIVAVGLYKYENKISVLHFNIEKHRTCEDTIKSKDQVFFKFGFRKFNANPIYSTSAPNCDKQKYEKFLFPGRNSVATIYAPITFPPSPVLIFKDEDCTQLIATGFLSSVNPDRIICKRIILTGAIAKSISKKFVTVRDMFYFPEDIQYFKKVELYTKFGRMGHIKESLGTHGRMKCLFDGSMNQQDTVCMNLYKRIYPKWIKDDSILLKN